MKPLFIYSVRKSNTKVIGLLLKVVIFLLLCWSIYDQVWSRPDLGVMVSELLGQMGMERIWLLLVAIGLMLASWGIEAYKWVYLIRKVERLSFFTGFKSILCGITLSLFTPNRIGEFGGRVLLLQKASKMEGVAITLVGSFSQIVASLSLSFIGLTIFYKSYINVATPSAALIVIAFLVSILLVLIFFNLKHFKTLFEKVKFLRKYATHLSTAVSYSPQELIKVLALSVLRFLLFSMEYFVLLWLFGVQLSAWEGYALIGSIFFVQTVVPSIALVELGIRGKVALYFAGILALNEIGVLTASFLLWGINLLIPALIGWVIISRINLNKVIFNEVD